MWLVETKFNAFYLAEKLNFVKEWKPAKRWIKMKNCWRITKSKRLFYTSCDVNSKYVKSYMEYAVSHPEQITFEKLRGLQ